MCVLVCKCALNIRNVVSRVRKLLCYILEASAVGLCAVCSSELPLDLAEGHASSVKTFFADTDLGTVSMYCNTSYCVRPCSLKLDPEQQMVKTAAFMEW